jgi:hypothetical protein
MKQSLSLFFILLCIQTVTTITGAVDTIRSTQETSHTHPSKQTPQKAEYDAWLDFDDEDEEQKPTTRWQRFMGGVDKFALQMKALWAFKIKPWWKEKHGKEITATTASMLATLIAGWMMYRRYIKTMSAIIEGHPSTRRNPFAPVTKSAALDATNPEINPFARTQGQSLN